MHIAIDGIEIKELTTYGDERGFFRELIRDTDPFFAGQFGQWSHALLFADVTKAWHYHRLQTDWWYVATGVIRVGLCDVREHSPTYRQTMDFLMGDFQPPRIVKIPPGVAHGCQTVQGPVHMFYITSHVYNPDDELRLPFNDPSIEFDWLNRSVIR